MQGRDKLPRREGETPMGKEQKDALTKWKTRAYMGLALVCGCALVAVVL